MITTPLYTPGQYSNTMAGLNGPYSGTMAGPYSGISKESQRDNEQLRLRRTIDNKIRYGKPVSDEEMATARRIGAISGGAVQTPPYQVSPETRREMQSNIVYTDPPPWAANSWSGTNSWPT